MFHIALLRFPVAVAIAADYRLGFRSLDRETDLASLPVRGSLPAWLAGTLLRNGPARFAVGTDRYRHWFDGLAMVHRFTIAGGNVSYANRFLRTPAFEAAERSGRIACSEFDTDPRPSLSHFGDRIRGRNGASDNANVTIAPYGDAYLALTETPSPVAFDGTTLETRGVLAYDDDVVGQLTTAHTLHDPERKATFNIVTRIGRTSAYQIVRIADGTLRRDVVATIETDKPAYLHAFSATERHIVIVEYPLVVAPLSLLLRRKPYIENYRWEPGRGTRIHVVRKDGGERVGTYETDAFFAFHHINAYDDGDCVVLDTSAYADAAIIGDFLLDRLCANDPQGISRAEFRRLRLVPGRAAAGVERLTSAATELPTVARARAAKPYRFAYGVDVAEPDGSVPFDRLVKVDVRERGIVAWSAPDAYPGEPLFVARPGATDEDDGVVLSVILDARGEHSYLVVLDGRSFEELARADVPHHIPFGFHGIFR